MKNEKQLKMLDGLGLEEALVSIENSIRNDWQGLFEPGGNGNGKKTETSQERWDRLQARQGFMAYLPIIVAVILLFLGGSWEYFRVHAAVAYYACYALTFWHGGGGVNLYHPVAHCNFLPTATLAMPPFHAIACPRICTMSA